MSRSISPVSQYFAFSFYIFIIGASDEHKKEQKYKKMIFFVGSPYLYQNGYIWTEKLCSNTLTYIFVFCAWCYIWVKVPTIFFFQFLFDSASYSRCTIRITIFAQHITYVWTENKNWKKKVLSVVFLLINLIAEILGISCLHK